MKVKENAIERNARENKERQKWLIDCGVLFNTYCSFCGKKFVGYRLENYCADCK